MNELYLVAAIICLCGFGIYQTVKLIRLDRKYQFLLCDYMLARYSLAPLQNMLKRMGTKEYRLKAGFEEFKFMRLYQVLKEYQSYLQAQIVIAKKELGDGEDSEVERLQGIKDDVEVCLKALVDNGSWKE